MVDHIYKFMESDEIDPDILWNNIREAINQLIERNFIDQFVSQRIIGLGIINSSDAILAFNTCTG